MQKESQINVEINKESEFENDRLKLENLSLTEKINSLIERINFLEQQNSERKKQHLTNKREQFEDISGIISQNSELKALNNQLMSSCEDIKRENEIILEDYHKIQMNYELIQQKYNEILEENTQLKNTVYNLRNQGKFNAAEKPRVFFQNNNEEKTNSKSSWSNNLFSVKKNEFPGEFIKSKFENFTENNNVKNNNEYGKKNELRLSNYREKDDLCRSLIKSTFSEKETKNSKSLEIFFY